MAVAIAAPSNLITASVPSLELHTIHEVHPEVHISRTIEPVASAVSHQSRTDFFSTPVVTPIVAPVLHKKIIQTPIVHKQIVHAPIVRKTIVQATPIVHKTIVRQPIVHKTIVATPTTIVQRLPIAKTIVRPVALRPVVRRLIGSSW